jgi:Putative DNA-binding domain
MALLHIPLDQITEQNVLDLIDAKAAETRVIEYKRATYGNAHKDYSEFLADVSSLANTSGGDLIIGIDAPKLEHISRHNLDRASTVEGDCGEIEYVAPHKSCHTMLTSRFATACCCDRQWPGALG